MKLVGLYTLQCIIIAILPLVKAASLTQKLKRLSTRLFAARRLQITLIKYHLPAHFPIWPIAQSYYDTLEELYIATIINLPGIK